MGFHRLRHLVVVERDNVVGLLRRLVQTKLPLVIETFPYDAIEVTSGDLQRANVRTGLHEDGGAGWHRLDVARDGSVERHAVAAIGTRFAKADGSGAPGGVVSAGDDGEHDDGNSDLPASREHGAFPQRSQKCDADAKDWNQLHP